jgi:hypothetical protein
MGAGLEAAEAVRKRGGLSSLGGNLADVSETAVTPGFSTEHRGVSRIQGPGAARREVESGTCRERSL